MLSKGRKLAEEINAGLTAVLLGHDVKECAVELADWAERVLVVDDTKLEFFDAEAYQRVLSNLITKNKPLLTLIGHTSFGVDLAPSLAVEMNVPLATDCIDLYFEDGRLVVTRQMYGGKVNVKALLSKAEKYLVTIRPATFKVEEGKPLSGKMIATPSNLEEDIQYKKFIEYIKPSAGEVDITTANIIVSIGRGIGKAENIPIVEELAEALGGVLACSRPISDKGWLPKDRHVGASGKTVKPKLYIAIGISGAFQHVYGMKSSDLIIAVKQRSKSTHIQSG